MIQRLSRPVRIVGPLAVCSGIPVLVAPPRKVKVPAGSWQDGRARRAFGPANAKAAIHDGDIPRHRKRLVRAGGLPGRHCRQKAPDRKRFGPCLWRRGGLRHGLAEWQIRRTSPSPGLITT
jgi:hypothetical protein